MGLALVPASANAAITAFNAKPFSALEGDETGDIRVVTFSDAPPCDADGYGAQISWGDGVVSAGRVMKPALISPTQCSYDVEARHAYRIAGVYDVSATISRGADTRTVTGTATIADAEVRGEAKALQAVAGRPFSGLVAEINDRNRASVGEDFTATVDWGDGSAPTPAQVSGTNGRHEVAGGHTYAAPGAYRIQVTVLHGGRTIVLDAGSAQVAAAPVFQAPSQDVAATASMRLLGSARTSRTGLRRNGLRVRLRLGAFKSTRLSYRIRDARNGRTVVSGRATIGEVIDGVASVRIRLSKRNLARLRRGRSYGLTLPRQGGLPTLQSRFSVVR
jgi:hypothetical protein